MLIVIFFYSQIVKAVVAHEAALKAQAKKMNVDSLRSNAVSLLNQPRIQSKDMTASHYFRIQIQRVQR